MCISWYLRGYLFFWMKKNHRTLPQCGISYIINLQGETMRILFTLIIAVLCIFFTGSQSTAHDKNHPCHQPETVSQIAGQQGSVHPCCKAMVKSSSTHSIAKAPFGLCCDCSSCEAISPLLIASRTTSSSTVADCDLIHREHLYEQLMLRILGEHSIDIPPPPLLSASAKFIQHCAFLI